MDKLEGNVNSDATSCFSDRNYSPGEAQMRLNEFLESRAKIKQVYLIYIYPLTLISFFLLQIMEKNHGTKQIALLKKFEAARMKVINTKVTRKHGEG